MLVDGQLPPRPGDNSSSMTVTTCSLCRADLLLKQSQVEHLKETSDIYIWAIWLFQSSREEKQGKVIGSQFGIAGSLHEMLLSAHKELFKVAQSNSPSPAFVIQSFHFTQTPPRHPASEERLQSDNHCNIFAGSLAVLRCKVGHAL